MNYYLKSGQKNLLKILQDNMSEDNHKVCFTFYDIDNGNDTVITRKQLLEKSLNTAAVLKSRGAKKGDRIIILSNQSVENVYSVVASMLVGTIFTIIPPPIDDKKKERFESVFKSCKPKFILCGDEVYNFISQNLNKQFEKYKGLSIINVDHCDDNLSFEAENLGLDDTIYIQYTSGSTSAPKGVEVSYGNMISAINCLCDVYKFNRVVGWVPFFHNLGLLYLIMIGIVNKTTSVGIIKPQDFLKKPSIWFEKISEFKADVTLAPNSVYEAYPKLVPARKLLNIDLSSLNVLANGSEIVSQLSLKKFANEYKDFGIRTDKFYNGYGLSEATCGISAGRYNEKDNLYVDLNQYRKGKLHVVNKDFNNSICFVSSGEAMKYTDIIIVDPKTLKKCKDDEFGEVWIKSPSIAKGYYNDEKSTKETFNLSLNGDREGYLRTGDIGIIRNQKLYITGRLKEVIIINGNNILPNDICEKLKENVSEIRNSVIAPFSIVKNNKERLVILVESFENINLEEEVKDKINDCIYKYFEVSPYDIRFVNKGYLPVTDSGKISLKLACKKYEREDEKVSGELKYVTETEKMLAQIIEKELSHKAGRDDNLLNLGMDSLEVVSLASLIEDNFNTEVTVSFIFENPSIKRISEYIDKSLNGEDVSTLYKDKDYLYKEVTLDEEIKPSEYKSNAPELKNVFLTGTTGFLGAYLIRDLMENTKARIYCHVRAKSKHAGLERIKSNMVYYGLWLDKYKDRITPVVGSLDEDNLGIDKEEYKYLSNHIDTVYHCGALLNFIYPYSRLKNTNVLGTVRTIKFACTGKAKYYNFISSYSIYDNPSHFNKDAYEDDGFDDCRGYFLSYSESKWVCENIIALARKRGLRVAIYRPGEITGDKVSGKWKLSDAVSRTIKSMIVTGVYPDIPMNIHMTQVDFISSAIIEISSKGYNYGRSYNLLNKKYVHFDWISEVLNSMNVDVHEVPYDEWKEMLFKSGTEHPLKLLESLFKVEKKSDESFVNRYGKNSPIYHMENTDQALIGTGIECPPIDDDILSMYMKNFI